MPRIKFAGIPTIRKNMNDAGINNLIGDYWCRLDLDKPFNAAIILSVDDIRESSRVSDGKYYNSDFGWIHLQSKPSGEPEIIEA